MTARSLLWILCYATGAVQWRTTDSDGGRWELRISGSASHRRDFCHFAGTPSVALLIHLLKGEGGAAE